jgi:predicted RNA-binding protein with PUA-like domain
MVAYRSQEDKAMSERTNTNLTQMSYWVVATDPSDYDYDRLERDTSRAWNPVTDSASQIYLGEMKKGDLAFLLYTGDEPALVAIVKLVSDPYPDPNSEDPELMILEIEPESRLETPVSLEELSDDPAFQDWDLVSTPDLEVAPVPPELWEKILDRSRVRVGAGR